MAIQKKRATKTSKGIHGGGGRVRNLSPVQLVLLGRGPARTFVGVGLEPSTQSTRR